MHVGALAQISRIFCQNNVPKLKIYRNLPVSTQCEEFANGKFEAMFIEMH